MSGLALKPLLARLIAGERLSEADAQDAFCAIMDGDATAAQAASFLTALRIRGETIAEIIGGARALRDRATAILAPDNAIDTCGTGGDGRHTLNISTAVAFVAAGAGVPVAKHGNRAASSRSGTADVLEHLGVKLMLTPERVEACLREAGVAFMFAPAHHGAMKAVGPIRAELGFRTVFNLLGPLTNPARVRRQLLGVFAPQWTEPLALALRELGSARAWVVHGADGLDELSTTGPSLVAELKEGAVTSFSISPEDLGLARASLASLVGGEPSVNAGALVRLLSGEAGAYRDIVLLNAAAALLIADKVADLSEGISLARRSIDEGLALKALERLIAVSNA
ncbi:MAG: anthranilate phosphoribosyltransferase [Alphaproteobacteria bacterium]|nr:anthranilate phosphoribosyltransferase [Alphaproteobacteria bacterium]